MSEKLTPVSRALVAAAKMPAPQARRILMLICESGMTMDVPQPTQGEIHYSKREKFIKRMKSSCDRVFNYARHETLRKIEKHFRDNSSISSAESGGETLPSQPSSLAVRLTFDKALLSEELLAALRDDQESALSTAGQQLFDEIGRDSVWRLPSQDALQFVQDRANLLANVPDEVHTEIMQSIEQGLQHGESRRELMARISSAFDEIGRSRAETIANTETAAAFNYARDKAMREAGVTHKRWLHSMSPLIKEPRPTHLEADGQVQPIDDPFDVGGVLFMRPADDSLGAGPEDIINCHCVSIAVEAPLKSGEGEGHPFRGNQWTGGKGGETTETERDLLNEYLGAKDPPEGLYVSDGANGLLRGFSRYSHGPENYTAAQRAYYQNEISTMQKMIERTPTTEDRVLYRGVTKRLSDKLTDGTVFQDKGFTSITTDKKIALDRFTGFSPEEKGRVFEVRVPKGTPLLDVDRIANPTNDPEYTTEREHILGHGTRFRVKGNTLEVLR